MLCNFWANFVHGHLIDFRIFLADLGFTRFSDALRDVCSLVGALLNCSTKC